MSERPAYHCGAIDCCEGSDYPDCQTDMRATISIGPDGAMDITPIRRGANDN